MRHVSQLDDEAIDAFRAGITWPKFWERYKADILRLHRPTAEFIKRLQSLVTTGTCEGSAADDHSYPMAGTTERPHTG